MAVCAALCGFCAAMQSVGEKSPERRYEQVPMTVFDEEGGRHTVLTRERGFHHSELVESLEGHSLVYWVDGGKATFKHITPCKKCAEEAYSRASL